MLSQKNTKSGRIIVLNAVLILLVIAFLIIQNIFLLDKNNNALVSIDQHHDSKVDIILSMTNVVRERSLQMLTMYFSSDPWQRDELFIDFHKLRLVFINLKSKLEIIGLSKDEKKLFNQIMEMINTTEVLQNDIVDRLHSGISENVHEDISGKDFPMERSLLDVFEKLINKMRASAGIARKSLQQQYQKTMTYVGFISFTVFLISIILILKSLRQIKKIESIFIDEAESLSWDASHDELTNVYNRRWLKYKFGLLQANQKNSFLYIDLDEFKPVNDTFGHQVGDRFLCGVTREIEQCIRQHDALVRMGGDEFSILLENCEVEKAAIIAECIVKRISRFNLKEGAESVSIPGCSIGICYFSTGNISHEKLIENADSACYIAKNSGKNQLHIFSKEDLLIS